jgi:hypothetical protein
MKSIKFIAIALLIITVCSCTKWLDVNKNPANPQQTEAQELLPPIQYQMANNLALDYRYLFRYLQYWGSPSADNLWEMHGYEGSSDNAGSIWRMTYLNLGPNLEDMIKNAIGQQKWTYTGIGYAIKAWAYQITTDYHGPIILNGAFDIDRLTFDYQDQPDVYDSVRTWCYTSLGYLDRISKADSTLLTSSTGDQIYKGNRGKWKKFVYGLLALQYSHLRNKAAFTTSYADSISKYVDLSFASSAEDATVYFLGTNSDNSNPFGPSQALLSSTSTTNILTGRVAQPIVSLLTGGVRGTPTANPKTSLDPRLTRMLAFSPDSIYRGVNPTYGDPSTVAAKKIVHVLGSVAAIYPGRYLFADKARFPIMSYAQLQFAKAEALFAQGKTTEAYAAYIKGIDGHMDFVNQYGLALGSQTSPPITTAQITAYKTSSEVAQTPASLKLSDIMSQKYIAQWGWAGLEQWCDLRKYHYDTAVFKNYFFYPPDKINASNKGRLAYRVRPRYNSEYVWNKPTLFIWGALNSDYHTYEMWFSQP